MHYASERATIISTLRKYVGPMKQMPRTKKDFEPGRLGVFATPGSLLTELNCEIRVQTAAHSSSAYGNSRLGGSVLVEVP